jgi:hypothetical protein
LHSSPGFRERRVAIFTDTCGPQREGMEEAELGRITLQEGGLSMEEGCFTWAHATFTMEEERSRTKSINHASEESRVGSASITLCKEASIRVTTAQYLSSADRNIPSMYMVYTEIGDTDRVRKRGEERKQTGAIAHLGCVKAFHYG